MKDVYVNPENLNKVSLGKLPIKYRERFSKKIKPIKKVNLTPEQRKRMETPEGERLSPFIRPKEAKGYQVKYNPKYDPNKPWKTFYAMQLQEGTKKDSPELGNKRWVPIYTEAFHKVHGTIKFEIVKQFEKKLPEVRKQYEKDMESKDKRKSMIATMVAITDESPIRSGNLKSAQKKKKKTYGLSTLLARHFTREKDQYVIRFLGKDSMPNVKYIKNPATVAKLDSILKSKKDSDFVFSIKGKRVQQQELSYYIKTIGGSKALKFHFFRHIHGTRVFKEMMDKYIEEGVVPDMPTQKELTKIIKQASSIAANLLGNQQQACIKSYILPQVIFDYYKKYNLEVPDIYKNLVFEDDRLTKDDLKNLATKKWNTTIDSKESEKDEDEDLDLEEDSNDEEKSKDEYETDEESNDEEEVDEEEIEEEEVEYEDELDDDEMENPETEDDDLIIEEEDDLIIEEDDEITSSAKDVDSIQPDDEKDMTYEERLKKREEFEDYLLGYQYDENDVFIDPAIVAHVLVSPDFVPDFTEIPLYVRPNYYEEVQKDKYYDPKKDVDKFGYNDKLNYDLKSIREEMEEKAKEDILRLTEGE